MSDSLDVVFKNDKDPEMSKKNDGVPGANDAEENAGYTGRVFTIRCIYRNF